MRKIFERLSAWAERIESGATGRDQRVSFANGFFHAEQCRIGCFFGGLILAGSFAKLLGGLRDVENVVGNLKRQAYSSPKIPQALDLGVAASGIVAARHQAGGDECPSLVTMDELQLFPV